MANDNLDNLADQLVKEAEEMKTSASGGAAAAIGGSGSPAGSSAGAGNSDHGDGRNLKMILDIPLKVTVELGRTKMPVSDLLNLTQGSVIELSKLAGDPMEVLVNDKLIARGEAVVVNEKFGVRLTDIISPTERVESLR